MPKFYPTIPPDLITWSQSQPLFFISSAPTSGAHINISPKGLPSTTFTIISPSLCAYIDATGSGAETISHLYENGRCTVMFCSFGTSPRILRFFCRGRVVEWDTPAFEPLLSRMGKKRVDGARAIILLDVFKVQTSCGYGVPKISPSSCTSRTAGDLEKHPEAAFEDRDTLGHFAAVKVERNEMGKYQVKNNLRSLDGLPALKSARRYVGEWLWFEDVKATGRRVIGQKEALSVGFLGGLIVVVVCMLLRSLISV